MDKAEFAGHRKLVDSFGAMDVARLKKMIGSQPGYHEFSVEELTALDKIPAVIVDQNWFQMYDQTLRYTDFFNPQALYYNYYLTAFKVVAMSPVRSCCCFRSRCSQRNFCYCVSCHCYGCKGSARSAFR